MTNIRDPEFNPNVVQVYTEEPGYTGYKGLDFTKIDQIEDLLRSGINVNITGANQLNINGNVTVSNEVEVTNSSGQAIPIFNSNLDLLSRVLVTGATIPSGLAVYQTALNKELDNVSVYVSGNLPAVSFAAGQTVGVTGSVAVSNSDILSLKNSLNNVIFSDTNAPSGVVVYQSNLNKDLDSVTAIVSGFNPLIFSDTNTNTPSGLIVYQSNLNKDLDNVTSVPEKSSNISTSTALASPGLAINANANRKELYIQNLSTQKLYVKYGQNATSESFNFVLAKNTEVDAGDGGSISDQSYTGIVTVFGTSPKYIAWERS